ncbi:energy-coupling factor transporter transmembrane component T [Candidatus Oleimmundimicrobium sp.]|uniref:energy-coupling factor transporter transmembrane component T family protein n=1 Tax=Candidatus Oleimmundimicrobium sp. TaxID=3060597 RepID=UPI0027216FDD|nr:energy-coupling factor transporter transmembrane component T [Candidatus Oleimmundimicrobium sp.]MDO8886031.1 energy-coupling factor transporter transmembrane component T [Candidatus Oleimmundimicrobium sp.]
MKTFSRLTIGQYYPGESLIHEADPRLKIVLLMAILVTLFILNNFLGFLYLSLFMLTVIAVARIPFSWILRGLRPLIYIILFTLIVHFFFTVGEPIARLGPFVVTEEGFKNGILLSARFILLVVGASLLTFTTSPVELTDGIEYLLTPFKKIKVPAHELAMMMTIALRFIPTLLLETDRIMKAQISRGADFESGNLFRRAKNLISLLIPLFVGVFRRADELALAMESRCYRGGEGRTRLRVLMMRSKDWAAGVATVIFLLSAIYIGRL